MQFCQYNFVTLNTIITVHRITINSDITGLFLNITQCDNDM